MTQDDTSVGTEQVVENNSVTPETHSTSENEIELLKAEIATLKEQLARSQADYSNLVRRTRDESAQI